MEHIWDWKNCSIMSDVPIYQGPSNVSLWDFLHEKMFRFNNYSNLPVFRLAGFCVFSNEKIARCTPIYKHNDLNILEIRWTTCSMQSAITEWIKCFYFVLLSYIQFILFCWLKLITSNISMNITRQNEYRFIDILVISTWFFIAPISCLSN